MSVHANIAVLAAGGRTPLGFDLPASAAAVRAGISGIGDHPYMIDRYGLPMKVTRDIGLDIAATGPDRAIPLAVSAATEALRGLAPRSARIDLLLSTGEARPGQSPGFPDAVLNALTDELGARFEVTGGVIAGGHAGGLTALHHAARALAENRAELCLVGGVDSYLQPETLEWLDAREQLHSEGNIYGFCPGEGAGFCLLARTGTAARLGLRPRLMCRATAIGTEPNPIQTETVCLGEGLGGVLAELRDTRPEGARPVDAITCDMNGERYRANEYGFAVLKSSGLCRDAADVLTPADCWGDLGTATGPLAIGLAVEAQLRGHAKGPTTLVWASSEGGARAAALLAVPEGAV